MASTDVRRIPSASVTELRRRFDDELSAVGDAEIARKTGIPFNSLKRMLKGENISGTDNLSKLFGALIYVPRTGNDIASERVRLRQVEQEVKAMIKTYCEPGVPKPAPGPKANSGPVLACMTVYIKFIHLRRKQAETDAPVYIRKVRRLGKEAEVSVFDEMLLMRTSDYKSPVRNRIIKGRRTKGVVDALAVFPPRTTLLEHYVGQIDSPEVVEFIEATPSALLQTSFSLFNGFQRQEDAQKQYHEVGSQIFEDCERLILVVDMTSLPIAWDRLFTETPVVFHMRANVNDYDLLKMTYAEPASGVFLLDSAAASNKPDAPDQWNPEKHTLLENDRVEFRLKFNWDAVNEQSKKL